MKAGSLRNLVVVVEGGGAVMVEGGGTVVVEGGGGGVAVVEEGWRMYWGLIIRFKYVWGQIGRERRLEL